MVRRYAERWAIEEEFEFLKQRFALEDVRVRSLKAIDQMMLLAMLAFAFLVHLVERFSLLHKRLMPVLCSTQSELDPDAVFL
jgi:transposase